MLWVGYQRSASIVDGRRRAEYLGLAYPGHGKVADISAIVESLGDFQCCQLEQGALCMPKYYFHIRDGQDLAHDPEGAEFETLEAARKEAANSARELLAQRLLRGDVIDGQAFELTTEDGDIADIVRFKDVMRLE